MALCVVTFGNGTFLYKENPQIVWGYKKGYYLCVVDRKTPIVYNKVVTCQLQQKYNRRTLKCLKKKLILTPQTV